MLVWVDVDGTTDEEEVCVGVAEELAAELEPETDGLVTPLLAVEDGLLTGGEVEFPGSVVVVVEEESGPVVVDEDAGGSVVVVEVEAGGSEVAADVSEEPEAVGSAREVVSVVDMREEGEEEEAEEGSDGGDVGSADVLLAATTELEAEDSAVVELDDMVVVKRRKQYRARGVER